MSVNQLPYEPIRFTGKGSDRRQRLVVRHRMDLEQVAVERLQEAFVQHAPFAEQDVDSFASVVEQVEVQTRAIQRGRCLSLIHI